MQQQQQQQQQQQDALLPRPRGSLPRVCAALLVTLATGGLRFVSPKQLLGWVALVTLMLTLGRLLHSLCLLAEEALHHHDTRYRGRGLLSHMVPACGLCGGTLAAASLASLLLYLAGDPLAKDADTWKLLILTSVFYALLKSLVVLGPSEVEVSDLCEARKTNVAHGLAWSFYLGYLKLVLPHLDGSIEWFRSTHLANGATWNRGSRRLLILIPLDASISHKLEDEDDNIRFYGNLPNCEIDRAGVRGRVYKHSVYRVFDQNGKGHECVVEYATPLLTLYRMSQESSSGFGEAARRQQVLLFYRTLRDILELSLECRNRYTLVLLNDDHTDDPHFLSSTILRHLQQQEKEEFCLGPPARKQTVCPTRCAAVPPPGAPPVHRNWHSYQEPMSREPTIMISLEKPQPLKEPVENTDDYEGAE